MAAEAKIIILVDQSQAVQALQTTEGAMAKVGSKGNVVFTGLARDQQRAAQAAQLLSQHLGVQLPRAAEGFLARTKLIGPALATAFNVAIAVTFAAALIKLMVNMREVTDRLAGITEEMRRSTAAAQDFSRAMDLALGATPQQRLRALLSEQAKLIEQIEAAKTAGRGWGLIVLRLSGDLGDLEVRQKEVNEAIRFYTNLLESEALQATREAAEATRRWAEATEELRFAIAGLPLKAALELGDAMMALARESEKALETIRRQAPEVVSLWEQMRAQIDPALLQATRNIKDEIAALELAQLEGIPRILEERKRELAQIDELIAAYEKFGISVADLERKRELVIIDANRRIQEEHERAFERMSQQIEGFFQQVFLSARSFSDVWKQLLQQLLRLFVTFVSQMIARWILGMRQMQSASAGGFGGAGGGGILGGILGGIFGGGLGLPGAGPGGTPPFFPGGAQQFLSAGLGFAAGPGGTPPFVGGGGGGTATNIGLLGRLGINLRGLGPIPGGVLAAGGALLGLTSISAAFGRGSPLLGALGGAAGGALIGTAILPGIGTAIGALIGGIAGLFAGIFGRGRLKRRATAVAVQGFAAMAEVVEQFRRFQVDFESALEQVNQVWAQMVQTWQGMGGVGRRSIRGQEPWFRVIVRQLEDIQRQRERRAAIIAALPIPQFQAGGLVDDVLRQFQAIHSSQGRVLAFLHQGEAVLNARAVQRLGAAAIQQLNQAPGFQGGGFVGSRVTGLRPPKGFGPQAGHESRPVSITVNIQAAPGMDARALAAFTIRELKRELRDRGLSLG